MPDEKTIIHSVSDLLARAKKTSACLIVVSGRTSVGKMFKLDRAELTIGRSTDADIMLDDEGVSRRHARIVVRPDGSVQLMDLNSTNGTFNNGDKVDVSALHDGDKIQIGSATILKFSYQDSIDEALQKNLYESATRDGLTHIYNKKYFVDTLRKEFAYCLRHRVPLSLVIIDIDHFKRVNDTYGHQAGDYVLARLSARINDTIRAEDVFARYGGEEFVVLLREAPEDKAFILAERLRRLIETTEFTHNGQQMRVTISAGIAALEDAEYTDPDSFIAAADKHLYRAKQAGRNRVEARMLGG
ncbi:MAG: GGDEF domain-containing protein [Deltaproteobacteria bacterium]|nr:GGDEF domain-containing protein [Deltaproteobacteria bacterium]